jgi:hypothetical protein
MPDLDTNIHFGGSENVNPDDLGRAEVHNFSTNIDIALRDIFQWDGKAIGTVALTLNHDNSKVETGVFVTRGDPNLSEFRAPCDQIWQEAPNDITLAVRITTLNPFIFSDGGLWSDLSPREKFRHHFFDRENAPILDGYAELGIGDFCLRMVCQPSSKSSGRKGVILKYTILLFPASAESLSDFAESKFPGFPGLKVGDGHFPMGPAPTAKWRCPIIPLIRPGTPFEENDNAPSSQHLRFAIAAVMRRSRQPDIARSCTSLATKWERIRGNPRELANNLPATTWPQHPPIPEQLGKYHNVFRYSISKILLSKFLT